MERQKGKTYTSDKQLVIDLEGVTCYLGFSGDTVVKNLPAMQEMQETRARSLGQEDPLEKEMVTQSSNLT